MQGLSKEQSDIIEKLISGGATCKTFPTHNTQYDMTDASQHRLCDINSGKPCIFGMILSDYDDNDMCFEIMMVLDHCDILPEDIDQVLCIGRGDFGHAADDCIEKLVDSGVHLLFDATGFLDSITMFPSFLITCNYGNYVYHGEPPQMYLDRCEMMERYDSYWEQRFIWLKRCRDELFDPALSASVITSMIEKMSYGYLDGNTRPENPLDEHLLKRFEMCTCSQAPSCEGLYEEEYRISFLPYNAVESIWKSTLNEFGIKYEGWGYDQDDMEDLLEYGHTYGVDEKLKAYFENCVPLEDLIA